MTRGHPSDLRVGVHTGEILREADDFFGQAVNYAARVAATAAGDEIVVSSLVRDLVGSADWFGEPREVELRGSRGRPTWCIPWICPDAREPCPVSRGPSGATSRTHQLVGVSLE